MIHKYSYSIQVFKNVFALSISQPEETYGINNHHTERIPKITDLKVFLFLKIEK